MKVYMPEELAQRSGTKGRRILVAVNGKVYDVSDSKHWIGGLHMKRHRADCDLSNEIKAAPHGMEVLEKFPAVGTLQEAAKAAPGGIKADVDAWLERHPFFRRHPHPAVVHFPIGLVSAGVLFEVLGLVLGSPRTEWASFCCLTLVMLSLPVVIATGLFTWWINYDCAKVTIIDRKRHLAYVSFGLGLIVMILRIYITDPMKVDDPYVIIYLIGSVILAGIVSYVGFLGGRLTFPY